ncbi:iron-containing alcohol dehydrogenase [Selenomonas sp. AB3002]|uniref:iron-containing alcohol dehydrogenase n=1 Tax=Selenomonas sp. AB3002 TaxID=1392502 RepID=UPI000496F0FB
MQSFNFKCPTEIVFGKGAEEHIAEKIKAYGKSRVFIVYGGGSVIETGLLPRIESQLTAAGLSLQVRGGVKPNPRLAWVRGAINDAMIFKADFILAVGGGSVIDSAKAVAHGVANPGVDIWDFWSGKVKLEKTTAIGAVLTLAAAGSETSDSAVLTNEETGKKSGLNTDLNRPTLAFMNPELAFTAPKRQVFCGIADILMHTMERYFTTDPAPNDMTDLIAEGLMKNVIKHSRTLLHDPKNYDAMSEIMWCGSLSHNNLTGLGRAKDFACHKLGHELSGRFDVTHGASLTTVWGSWAGYVWQDNPERFAKFAEKVWDITEGTVEEKAQKGIEITIAYFKELDMPTNFTELGIGVQNKEMIEYLADMVTANGTKTVATFHPIDKETAMEIYNMANH